MKAATMPVMAATDYAARRVASLPAGMFSQGAERNCLAFHGQDLDTVAARGGLSAGEAVSVLTGVPYRQLAMHNDTAHRVLKAMHLMFLRGRAEAAQAYADTTGDDQ